MAHIIRYTLLDTVGTELTAEGIAIYDAYSADGRVSYRDEPGEAEGTKVIYLTFDDEATASAYLAEFDAINEHVTTGDKRSGIVRYDEA